MTKRVTGSVLTLGYAVVKSADAYYDRGNIRFELGDKQGAFEDYTQALGFRPNDADTYYNRAN
ncbi:MAG: tetratricopeptide repeat protein, partial [Leptolyngbya sp. SIO1D8]|nr:tetratricopeptide repeat protein [Leptolyngbya sp. SIO1D8]